MSHAHRNLLRAVNLRLHRGRLVSRNDRFVGSFNMGRYTRSIVDVCCDHLRWYLRQPGWFDVVFPAIEVTDDMLVPALVTT